MIKEYIDALLKYHGHIQISGQYNLWIVDEYIGHSNDLESMLKKEYDKIPKVLATYNLAGIKIPDDLPANDEAID